MSQTRSGAHFSDENSRAFGEGIAQINAIKREKAIWSSIESSNRLSEYIHWVCLMAVFTYSIWCTVWIRILRSPPYFDDMENNIVLKSVNFDLDLFKSVSYLSCGVLIHALFSLLSVVFNKDVKHPFRLAPILCSLMIYVCGFIGHFSMARGWFPVVISSSGRVNHVSRWGMYIALVPVLTVAMTSLDVRNDRDYKVIWESTITQLVSIILASIRNIGQNLSAFTRWTLDLLSTLLFLHIYYVLYKTVDRYATLSKAAKSSKVDSSRKLLSKLFSENSISSTRDLVAHLELITATMAMKLALFCSISWTVKAGLWVSGVLNWVGHTEEAILLTVTDCLNALVYGQALHATHSIASSPESLIGRVLIMEEQANASVRQFLRFAYHEISTPLNTISMTTQHLEDEKLSPEGDEMLKMAKESCLRIRETLTELLNFQNAEEGVLVLHSEPFNLKSLIKYAASQYTETATLKGVTLLLAVDSRIPDILLGEKSRLHQVLTTLIANGISFASEIDGSCAVMAELKDHPETDNDTAYVRVAVRDNGKGFSDDQVSQMFKAYAYLTPGGGGIGRGLGLDLCIARQIVELHGGLLSIETSENNGSTFYFDICYPVADKESTIQAMASDEYNVDISSKKPFTRDDAYSIPLSPSRVTIDDHYSELQDTRDISMLTRQSALVVDDVLSNRKMLQRTLEKLGFEVESCEDGDILVTKVCQQRRLYDVIFLDNMMPRLRGVDAVRILRREKYRGLVVGVTGNVLKEDMVEFLNAGCDDVLPKPVNSKIILDALRPHGIGVRE